MGVLSGQRDVLTGLVSNGRPETVDGERVLGLFLNTLPHRQQLGGGSWSDLARETFATEHEGLPFRRYPLAQMQQDRGGLPLFETAFDFTHFHVYQQLRGLRNLQVLGVNGFNQTNFPFLAEFNLDLATSEVHLNLKYDAGKICDEYATTIGSSYATTLTAMAREPAQRYAYCSLLSPQEQQNLLAWNETRADYPPGSVHELFEKRARKQPDALAIAWEEAQITYGELNRRANQLAHHLRGLGIGPEKRVGICLERSLAMIVGLLAILKAGGAYVPLDPSYPAERLSFILAETRMPVLLTQQGLLAGLSLHGARAVLLDTESEAIARELAENPLSGVAAENLAYVIYTSGSTGTPKGVQIAHRSVVNFLHAMRQQPGLSEQDRLLSITSLSFDIAALELFLPLMVGAHVTLVSRETATDSAQLALKLMETGATVMQATPATWQLLVHVRTWGGSPLKILCGGEALSRNLPTS